MQEHEERWKQLCAQAAQEQDPAQLQEFVKEINFLLNEKYKRLSGEQPPKQK